LKAGGSGAKRVEKIATRNVLLPIGHDSSVDCHEIESRCT
jgi:hypothetical protein